MVKPRMRKLTQIGIAALALAVIGSGATLAGETGKAIPQPKVDGLPVAAADRRVDLSLPGFTRPTGITNPLFPVSQQASVLFTGRVDDKPFRAEVTLLPFTRIVVWEGIEVETLVSQYVGYLDGRVQEVAYDLYAQADDGSVWFFGGDVSDFRDGVITTKEGSWLAGKDGPPSMIMPGKPKVGDAFRAENIPGIAFEEVTVSAIDHVHEGALRSIPGSLVVRELHFDATYDEKTFVPGYGAVFTSSDGDVEALVLAVPTDALSGPVPADLATLTSSALSSFEAAGDKDWKAATAAVEAMQAAWERVAAAGMPKPIEPILGEAVKALAAAVEQRSAAKARQAAIETARWSLDLQLRHRPAAEIDRARFDLWAAQVLVDAAAEKASGVNSDMFTLMLIRDRILHTLGADTSQRLNIQLGKLMSAAADEEFDAASEAADKLREIIAGVKSAQ